MHSIVADPLMKGIRHFDLSHSENSLAFSLGFVNIDMSDVGPNISSQIIAEIRPEKQNSL